LVSLKKLILSSKVDNFIQKALRPKPALHIFLICPAHFLIGAAHFSSLGCTFFLFAPHIFEMCSAK
jgi:hypothetical protein